MRKSRFSEAQIVGILKEVKAGEKPQSCAGRTRSARRRCTRGDRGTAALRRAISCG